jgi:hypothetical protein
VGVASTVNVIHAQKFFMQLTAAGTFCAIAFYDGQTLH